MTDKNKDLGTVPGPRTIRKLFMKNALTFKKKKGIYSGSNLTLQIYPVIKSIKL